MAVFKTKTEIRTLGNETIPEGTLLTVLRTKIGWEGTIRCDTWILGIGQLDATTKVIRAHANNIRANCEYVGSEIIN